MKTAPLLGLTIARAEFAAAEATDLYFDIQAFYAARMSRTETREVLLAAIRLRLANSARFT